MSDQRRFVVTHEDDDEPVTLADGTVLDGSAGEAYVERVLAEARLRNLVPGGKSLSGGRSHSPVVQARVPEDLHAALIARAQAEGVSVSRVARKALEQYLAS